MHNMTGMNRGVCKRHKWVAKSRIYNILIANSGRLFLLSVVGIKITRIEVYTENSCSIVMIEEGSRFSIACVKTNT
jgi:hypothetical protein